MNFYSSFCGERLKEIEEQLIDAGEALDVSDDEEIDAPAAMAALANITSQAALAQSMLSTMAAATVYKIGQTYLQQDAVAIEDAQVESEAIAEIGRVAVAEAYTDCSPAPIGIGHGYTHPAYPRVLSRIPIKHIYPLGPKGLFNGCLFQNNGESLFACRTQGYPSRTALYRPAEDLLFADPVELSLPEKFLHYSIEDMRIFQHAGATMASFTSATQTEKGWLAVIALASIGNDRRFSWVHHMDSPKGERVEKNWVFFSHDDRLFMVYYPSPHVVYEVEFQDGKPVPTTCWEAENWKAAGFMENARGGAPPVLVGDEFYHFYHSQHRHGYGTAYQTGLYTFEAKPPWNLKRIVKGPLLGLVPSKRPCDVIFVTGAGLAGDRWNLSCGLMDQETVGISLGFDDVERLLEPVK